MKLRSASKWTELHALEGFVQEQLPVAVMVQGVVVGQYEMLPASDLRPCGIANCSRAHRHGFIVELPDGRVSHVGRNCGQAKFGARWNQMLKRFRSARDAQSSREANEKIRAEALMALADVKQPPELEVVREQLDALDTLPAMLCDELRRRAQKGEARIERYRDPTREEVDRAKFHGERIPARTQYLVGMIQSIKAVAPHSRADFTADVRLPQRMRELRQLLNDPTAKTNDIAAGLRALREARDLLQRGVERAAEFFTTENLSVLRHLDATGRVQKVSIDVGPPFRILLQG